MSPYHVIKNVMVNNGKLTLTIDGNTKEFSFTEMSARLSNASQYERERLEISPSGYGIHWPLLDEDISIDGLLGIKHELPLRLAA